MTTTAAPTLREDDSIQGEAFAFPERHVVAVSGGRLRREELRPGDRVEAGTLLGTIHAQKQRTPVEAPVPGTFLGWVTFDHHRVWPGRLLARLAPDPT